MQMHVMHEMTRGIDGNCSPPGWEGRCSSCSSTNSGAAGSGRQQRGDGWLGESEGWSYRMPPTRCHLQTQTQLIPYQRGSITPRYFSFRCTPPTVRHFYIQKAEIHLFSWAQHSSGHTLWQPCLWGTSVGICSWNKHDTPPAQRDRIQRFTYRT